MFTRVSQGLWTSLTSLFLVFRFAACIAETAPDAPPVDFEAPISRATLDNGLQLVVASNGAVPLVSALVAFRAGSLVEGDSVSGYSHLFEHMIFQGSAEIPDSVEFRDRLDSLGVYYGAGTSMDTVTYELTVERDALDDALALLAGALRRPALLDAELEKEKQVVSAEFDLHDSDWDDVSDKTMLQNLFGEYFSRVYPLGSRDTVASATSKQLRDFHDKYYIPNNALLVLSGDITLARGRRLAESCFGDWKRANNPFAKSPLLAPETLEQNRNVVLQAPVNATTVRIAWQGPGARDDAESTLAGALLSEITFQTSHNFRSLVGPSLARGAGLYFSPHRVAGYVFIELKIPPGNEKNVVPVLNQVLAQLGKSGDISSDQLGDAKDSLWAYYFLAADDPGSTPEAVAEQWGLSDVDGYATYIDDLYAIDRADLNGFVERYMCDRPRVVVFLSSPENISEQGIDKEWLEERIL